MRAYGLGVDGEVNGSLIHGSTGFPPVLLYLRCLPNQKYHIYLPPSHISTQIDHTKKESNLPKGDLSKQTYQLLLLQVQLCCFRSQLHFLHYVELKKNDPIMNKIYFH